MFTPPWVALQDSRESLHKWKYLVICHTVPLTQACRTDRTHPVNPLSGVAVYLDALNLCT